MLACCEVMKEAADKVIEDDWSSSVQQVEQPQEDVSDKKSSAGMAVHLPATSDDMMIAMSYWLLCCYTAW
jgi:hypothetical protein